MKNFLIIAVMLLAVGLGALVAARYQREEKTFAPPPARKVEAPREAAPVDTRGFVGVIFPRQQVDLASSASARVEDVKVTLGTRLKKGDVVATLDAKSLRREVAAASAAARAASAEAKSARVASQAASEKQGRLEEYKEAVAGEEIINASNEAKLSSSRVSAASARVSEAMARVEQLRVLVENSAITAPFDGVVAARYVDPGALVNAGQPIARLISADDLWVRFAVPDDQAGLVEVKGCVTVEVDSPPMRAHGVVEMVAPQVDTELRMLVVEARLQLPEEWKNKVQAGLASRVLSVPCVTP
ncbi:MAG TPA: efflux RND transporter periplasmic adaptor subunit [Kofleriaceae bacterium]|nr:efflux RND transporter periplasmic adaptor subunit [Kofleriaceae bacterium]